MPQLVSADAARATSASGGKFSSMNRWSHRGAARSYRLGSVAARTSQRASASASDKPRHHLPGGSRASVGALPSWFQCEPRASSRPVSLPLPPWRFPLRQHRSTEECPRIRSSCCVGACGSRSRGSSGSGYPFIAGAPAAVTSRSPSMTVRVPRRARHYACCVATGRVRRSFSSVVTSPAGPTYRVRRPRWARSVTTHGPILSLRGFRPQQ